MFLHNFQSPSSKYYEEVANLLSNRSGVSGVSPTSYEEVSDMVVATSWRGIWRLLSAPIVCISATNGCERTYVW